LAQEKRETGPKLAVLGAPPAFDQPLHVGSPNIPDPEAVLTRIRGVLERRWLTNNGPCVIELEKRIAAIHKVEQCVAMCNGTLALEAAIRALGMTGEVIIPSYTFIATAHALSWQGITPVFADVDRATHTLDPSDVERRITEHTTGIIGVHLWGQPAATEALSSLAQRKGLRLLFDAAHAFGASHEGKMVGGFGDAEIFSFHATKFFNTFEGGAVVTNDAALADNLRFIRNFGFAGLDNVIRIGTNAKMPEVCAAMGLASLETLPHIVEVNRSNYLLYRELLSPIPGLDVFEHSASERRNFQYVIVTTHPELAGLTRDELVVVLRRENVLARRYFAPGAHRMAAYRETHGTLDLPNTDWLSENVFCLPTGSGVSQSAVRRICEILDVAVRNASTVRRALGRLSPH
jgi:dTDP-4-amino-4,6-dideoxygalactose transaminase